MTAFLSLIDPVQIPAVWPRIEALVSNACKRSSGRYEAQHVRANSESGHWQLWITETPDSIVAIGGTQIIEYPTGLKSIHWHYGTGSSVPDMEAAMDTILDWAKGQGCSLAEGQFRIGWKRVFRDWEHTHEVLEKAL